MTTQVNFNMEKYFGSNGIWSHNLHTHVFLPGQSLKQFWTLQSITLPLLVATTLRDLWAVAKTSQMATGNITQGLYIWSLKSDFQECASYHKEGWMVLANLSTLNSAVARPQILVGVEVIFPVNSRDQRAQELAHTSSIKSAFLINWLCE